MLDRNEARFPKVFFPLQGKERSFAQHPYHSLTFPVAREKSKTPKDHQSAAWL